MGILFYFNFLGPTWYQLAGLASTSGYQYSFFFQKIPAAYA
jgi:hypothetical protein